MLQETFCIKHIPAMSFSDSEYSFYFQIHKPIFIMHTEWNFTVSIRSICIFVGSGL